MSGPPPAPLVPLTIPPATGALPASAPGRLPASSVLSDASSPSGGAITLESLARSIAELTHSIADTNRNVAAMQSAWASLVQPPPPPHPHPPPTPLPTTVLPTAGLSSTPSISSTRVGPPAGALQQASAGVPLSRISWPASPSPIPSWAMGSLPVYSSAPVSATSPQHQPVQSGAVGTLYGGIDGTAFGGSGSVTDFPPIPGLAPTLEAMLNADNPAYAGPPGSAHAPPHFYKLDFSTFDGVVDPLNWLNQCEQFFRGQRNLASDRTWLASYHLRGAAQTWYYALERDEGMPT
jgi:hypothetical protein